MDCRLQNNIIITKIITIIIISGTILYNILQEVLLHYYPEQAKKEPKKTKTTGEDHVNTLIYFIGNKGEIEDKNATNVQPSSKYIGIYCGNKL